MQLCLIMIHTKEALPVPWARCVTGYRRLYLCNRFFEQKMAKNKDKNTHRLENNGRYSSISLV